LLETKLPASLFHPQGEAFTIFTKGAQKKQDIPNLISTSRTWKRENSLLLPVARAKLERARAEAAGGQKNVTNKNLSKGPNLPHVVGP
jgi:hypothetical protein